MKTSQPTVSNLAIIAQLFERMDRSAASVDPAQYRAVAGRLGEMLEASSSQSSDASAAQREREEVLDAFPAARELYENMRYADAGLCRSPLQQAIDSEVKAHDLLERIREAAMAVRPDAAPGAVDGSVA